LNPDAAILYQGPESKLIGVRLPSGIAEDDYYVCVIVAVADAYLAQTCTAAKVQVGSVFRVNRVLQTGSRDILKMPCATNLCMFSF
jgi:preprotein translocase subunit SecB